MWPSSTFLGLAGGSVGLTKQMYVVAPRGGRIHGLPVQWEIAVKRPAAAADVVKTNRRLFGRTTLTGAGVLIEAGRPRGVRGVTGCVRNPW
jgi:hypothetical protein